MQAWQQHGEVRAQCRWERRLHVFHGGDWWVIGGSLVGHWWVIGGSLVSHWWVIGGSLEGREWVITCMRSMAERAAEASGW